VDDALALSYLLDIWGIRPDLKTATSRDANAILATGGKVYAVVDATPLLLAELATEPRIDGLSADWIELTPNTGHAAAISSSFLFTVTPDLLLADAGARPAPTGHPLSPPTAPGLDVRLTWHLPNGIWPGNLAISLRPTHQGKQLLDPATGQPIQQDRPRPLYGLWPDSPIPRSLENPIVVHDTYRLPLPAPLPDAADGILVILYTQIEGEFQNVAEIPLSLSDILRNRWPTMRD
jgi:hypothetical protein